MKIQELKNKKIAILWYWREGQSNLRFLISQGITDITILDKSSVTLADNYDVQIITWDNYLSDLNDYDIILKSPGVSPFQPELLPYRDKFISSTQIFFSNYSWKVIGITGTKGKSTCSTLLYQLLQKLDFKVQLVWNIWTPVLDEIDLQASYDYIVYELSSYMLQDFCPHLFIWYLNNIYPCHLDWHYDSLTIYKEAKINILRNSNIKIIHGDLSQESDITHIKESKVFFDTKWSYTYDENNFYIDAKVVSSWSVALNGEHNRKNISWVIAILDNIGISQERLSNALQSELTSFKWLPHRIEDIWTFECIRFINDAIATTPQSTIAAIKTFDWELQTLFIWGQDSGFEFSDLRYLILNSSIQNIIAFPDTSELIFPEIEVRDYEIAFEVEIEGRTLQFIKTRSMKKWVDFAFKTTLPGRSALLSCGAPSFSLWKSYTHKADEFIQAVKSY